MLPQYYDVFSCGYRQQAVRKMDENHTAYSIQTSKLDRHTTLCILCHQNGSNKTSIVWFINAFYYIIKNYYIKNGKQL